MEIKEIEKYILEITSLASQIPDSNFQNLNKDLQHRGQENEDD